MAVCIGIEFADPTTFEATRLMYWPSCCKDSEYVFTFGDKQMLYADGLLNVMNEKYGDWRDVSKWPQVPGADNAYKKLAMKQSDPLSKAGVVGAFCRTYDIYGAMDTYLDGIYAPVDDSRGRYTYLGGSTTGGAVVYDNGMFLYSHHSTDPCCGRLVNAFDLCAFTSSATSTMALTQTRPRTGSHPTRRCATSLWRTRGSPGSLQRNGPILLSAISAA